MRSKCSGIERKNIMKKKTRLITSVFTAIIMSLQICALSVKASANENDAAIVNSSLPRYALEIISEYSGMYPDKHAEICGVVQTMLNSDSYIAEYNYSAESAVETMKRTLDAAFGDFPVLYGADYHGMFYADYTVPTVKQATNIYCGPAAILQTLVGNGIKSNTSSNNNYSVQKIEADAMETDLRGRTQPFKMTERLNSYYGGEKVYSHYGNTIYTETRTIISYLTNCFVKGRCPMACLEDTAYLDYYNGASFGHWVTISAIDDLRKTMTLVDPHYDSKYGGMHIVTYDEFFDALGVNDGYIVY